jgi:hypothetical protein
MRTVVGPGIARQRHARRRPAWRRDRSLYGAKKRKLRGNNEELTVSAVTFDFIAPVVRRS